MLALRTARAIFTLPEAERIAREHYGIVACVHPLPGERDANFHLRGADGREHVLKIIDPEASPETTDCQLRVLRHVAEQDPTLPVPRIFPTLRGEDAGKVEGAGGSYTVCLVGYLGGRLLSKQTPGPVLLENLGRTLARLDRALQGFFHPALGQRIAWDVRRLPELVEFAGYIPSAALRDSVQRAAAALEERMPALRSLRGQAIHGDCHGQNLLVDGDSISGILDFGDMIHAPRALEPAVTLAELLMEDLVPLGALAPVLQGYSREARLESGEIELLYDLIVARQAATILVHAWRGRHDVEGARVLDAQTSQAARSLEALQKAGREALTATWHRAAGTRIGGAASGRAAGPEPLAAREPPGVLGNCAPQPPDAPDLSRRHRLMGAGAELFYERPLHLVRGSGVWLYDPLGRSYLDVYNNVPHVGHAHPKVVRAIQEQVATLATHTRYLHSRILDYAERLTATLPAHLNACIFVNSGSEANDVAWRIAQSTTGRRGALVVEHAYHGITDAVAALTPGTGQDPRVVTLAAPRTLPGQNAPRAPSAGGELDSGPEPCTLERAALAAAAVDADQALRTLAERGFAPAAFFIDSALTSSGIYDPPAAWGTLVAERVRSAGALIVADEVQYGLGRSGSHFWGFERRGMMPDIVTLGKPVGNGYPMGVVIASRELIEAFQRRYGFFSTFGGNAVAAAAGLAVLEVLESEELVSNAAATGEYFRRRLAALGARHPCLGAVRGTGLLLGVEVKSVGAHTARQCAKRLINMLAAESRVLIGYEGPDADVLKLRPPMPFRPEHADLVIAAIEAAAARVSRNPDAAK